MEVVPTWKTQDVSNPISLSSSSTLGLSQHSTNSSDGTSIQRCSHQKLRCHLEILPPCLIIYSTHQCWLPAFNSWTSLKAFLPVLVDPQYHSPSTVFSSLVFCNSLFLVHLSYTASSFPSWHTTLQPGWLHLSSLSMPHSLPPWGLGTSSCSCMEHTFSKPPLAPPFHHLNLTMERYLLSHFPWQSNSLTWPLTYSATLWYTTVSVHSLVN